MTRKFDAIVIGSGLGGLTAGALCARGGMRVLVLERNDAFGGAATIYRHNGLFIEAALHEIDGFDEEDPKLPLIRSLGLDRDLEFIDVGDLYEVRGSLLGEPFMLPHGLDAALAAATARFPQHKAALAEYFRRLAALRGAVSLAARHRDDRSWWLTHAPEAVRKLWPILRDGRATVGEAMRDLFGDDEEVKLALAGVGLCRERRVHGRDDRRRPGGERCDARSARGLKDRPSLRAAAPLGPRASRSPLPATPASTSRFKSARDASAPRDQLKKSC
jgi:all-trans-retinol 13,14-reductase